jgi:hypothetical protein
MGTKKSNIKDFGELIKALKKRRKPNLRERLSDLSIELREERLYKKRLRLER